MTSDDRDRLRELAEMAPGARFIRGSRLIALLDDLRDAEAERDRLRAALERIANPPPETRNWDFDARFYHAVGDAALALAPDPPAGT